ncbi:MAG: HDIG domain-containing protein [Lachnospiraceae bacterium]|nr:HDIG domain-containing protein [Lachnospiraceae bacterium]
MLPVELDPEIRAGVFKTLPQMMEIQNEELREKVADAWAFSLQINGYKHIEDMPGSGMPEASSLGDQSMHIRAVGYNAVSLYENLCKAYERDMGLERDMLIACALLHDVGKPYEYNPENRARWAANYKFTGAPNARHPAYGTYIAITCGLPEEVVHVCACHSPEGRFVTRSAYATLVHYADDGSWFSLASMFDLNIPKL